MEPMEVHLNQPVNLELGSKEGTGMIQFMGGSFYVTGLGGNHIAGNYEGAVLGSGMYNGQPSPRRVLELKKKADGGK